MKTTLNRIQAQLTAVLTAVLFLVVSSAQAQEGGFKPFAYIGIQGGGQKILESSYKWTPTGSVSVGAHFTPTFGARLHVNGIWNKNNVYKFKYVTTDLDAMINIVNLFNKKDYRPFNVYLIGGVGLNYSWDYKDYPTVATTMTTPTTVSMSTSTSDSKNFLSHNFRVGTMFDVNIARNLSANVEFAFNNIRLNGRNGDAWQFTAQAGLAYKFGIRQKVKGSRKDADVSSGDPNTSGMDSESLSANTNVGLTKAEPKPEPKPATPAVVEPKNVTRNIFFSLRSTDVSATELPKVAEIATWLKDHPTAKVVVTGYADKGTGTAPVNARYAKMRAESVTKLLTKKYGIAASRITTDSKGDTVQPFPNDNDKNRVTIMIAEE